MHKKFRGVARPKLHPLQPWVVETRAAKAPRRGWNSAEFRRVLLVHLAPSYAAKGIRPRCLNPKDRGILEILDFGTHRVGKTDRGAYQKAIALAEEEARLMNVEVQCDGGVVAASTHAA